MPGNSRGDDADRSQSCQRVHIRTRTFAPHPAAAEPVERKAREGARRRLVALTLSPAARIRIYLLLIVFNTKDDERKYD
jgi:hypothetical protein